ncbi:MAG TPA: hypothetical protein VFZ53_07825 [Polyangiaceae bacterium]
MSSTFWRSPWLRSPPPSLGWALLCVQLGLYAVALLLAANEPLFLASGERGGQGIDFFCVPKAYANLLAGRSAFDTWGAPAYGPHATWFVLHPAVAVWVGGFLWFLRPWLAYAVWVLVTLGLLAASAALIAHHARTPWRRVLVFAALLVSPLTYWLLFVGNVHAIVLFATALLLVGLHELAEAAPPAFAVSPRWKIGMGLVLSFLSKPVLLLVVPGLLLVRATRRPALSALGVYGVVSAAFLLVPSLNPESVGLERLLRAIAQPGFAAREFNVYEHRFVLVPEMLDNAMHWLHMLVQSGYRWNHAQLFSLPVLLPDSVPAGVFRLLAILPLVLTVPLFWVSSSKVRLQVLAWVVLAALASHFLGYAIAWEYQYTQLLVAAAALLALPIVTEGRPRAASLLALGLLLLFVPTPYVWLRQGGLSPGELTVLRLFRVVPAAMLALASVAAVVALVRAPVVLRAPENGSASG